MLQVIEVTGCQLKYGFFAETYDVICFIHACYRQTRLDPAAHGHRFTMGNGRPGLDLSLAKTKSCLALRPLPSRIGQVCDFQVAFIRMPRANRARAVYPELMKEPFSFANLGDFRGPKIFSLHRNLSPVANPSAPAEDWLFIPVSSDVEAGILRIQYERLG